LVSIAPPAGSAQNDNSSVRVSPQGMDNKRQILEYLQQRCSIEFLREHRLNSHSESVLRKTSGIKVEAKNYMDLKRAMDDNLNCFCMTCFKFLYSIDPSIQNLLRGNYTKHAKNFPASTLTFCHHQETPRIRLYCHRHIPTMLLCFLVLSVT
jgi:hypothetical protein